MIADYSAEIKIAILKLTKIGLVVADEWTTVTG